MSPPCPIFCVWTTSPCWVSVMSTAHISTPTSSPALKHLSPQLLGGLASMALPSPSQEIASQSESCLPQGHSPSPGVTTLNDASE